MTPTLTREPKPTVRPRKPRGAVLEPVILHAEVVQIPRKRPPVTVKPERRDRRELILPAIGLVSILLSFLLVMVAK